MDPVKLKITTLRAAPDDRVFCVCRGDCIRKIDDLANCIESLQEGEFRHHVDEEFDHFSDWIRNVLKNELLANDLLLRANKDDKEHYVMTIRHHVDWLRSIPTPKKMTKIAKKKSVKKKTSKKR